MANPAHSLVTDLERTLSKAPTSHRVRILRGVTEIFLVDAGAHSSEQIQLFDDILCRLIDSIDASVLVELCSKLAQIEATPINVIARLSKFDDIAVAGPVLEKCEGLSDQTLIAVASKKSQKHLASIAGRRIISEPVSDVLVDRGNQEIACKVAANHGAHLTETSYVKLIKKSKGDRTLGKIMSDRTDIPPELWPFLKLALGNSS